MAARGGCRFWTTLLKGNDYVFDEHHEVVYFSKYLEAHVTPDQHRINEELGEFYNDDDGKIMLSYIASSGVQPSITFKLGRGPGQVTNFHIWVHPDERLRSLLSPALPPNLAPKSELSFYRARTWIQECLSKHKDCNLRVPEEANFIPRRVLKVQKGTSGPLVRLVSQPAAQRYVTLSYCWGGDQPAKLVKDKVAAYSAGIPFQSLPRAIQDAILVTIGIDISYLWVDALCIIQDDDDDKADQIIQMHRIYQYSHATIAASVSRGSTDGFLHNRQELRPIKMSGRLDDNVFGDFVFSPGILEQEGIFPEASLPLFQRAWTFQETHLPRRILSYGHQGLTYRCLFTTHTEGVAKVDDINIDMAIDPGNSRYNTLPHPDSWHAIIAAYTQRQLTVASDKLLGIAALAAEYSRQKGTTEYYAGLWEEDFHTQLLWVTYNEESSPKSRHGQYIAPSWSWASTNYPVWVHDDFAHWADMLEHGLEQPCPPLDHFCTLLDANISLVDSRSPFGMVSAGFIKVRAKTKRIAIHVSHESPSLKVAGRDVLMTSDECLDKWPQSGGYDPRFFFNLDYPAEVVDGHVYSAIEICGVTSAGSEDDSDEEQDEKLAGRSYGLLLEMVGSDTYRRLGLITLSRQDVWGWVFDIPESQEVIIV
ncbi:hypothetical protein PFICI_05832 [Pestalotiopsis fici W106-1]|uniref:Heterokaryon incompatibility domain-containing protein n=1 Tax=Pestalotiopsis fici (strain W106-1 / CGMCC3.15140) TaxID=1229662 RepID=W3XFG4_PESFW|nr:uncharacterized protein PFICI_05832 [Pestalotiopsis fici W106-1]ETS83956.1 hypothetical protein PFICI_05832 [Pestalotiopsis fici W106-1]